MSGKRQNIQLVLAFPVDGGGEAPEVAGEGTEPSAAGRRDESPARDSLTGRTAVYGPVCTVVWEGVESRGFPLSPILENTHCYNRLTPETTVE